MLGETGRQEVTPICGNGDIVAYGSPRITAIQTKEDHIVHLEHGQSRPTV
jgi:hypothetical protein